VTHDYKKYYRKDGTLFDGVRCINCGLEKIQIVISGNTQNIPRKFGKTLVMPGSYLYINKHETYDVEPSCDEMIIKDIIE
jgi:hypothetical protein